MEPYQKNIIQKEVKNAIEHLQDSLGRLEEGEVFLTGDALNKAELNLKFAIKSVGYIFRRQQRGI